LQQKFKAPHRAGKVKNQKPTPLGTSPNDKANLMWGGARFDLSTKTAQKAENGLTARVVGFPHVKQLPRNFAKNYEQNARFCARFVPEPVGKCAASGKTQSRHQETPESAVVRSFCATVADYPKKRSPGGFPGTHCSNANHVI